MTGSEDHIKDVSTHRISLVAARCEPPHIDIDRSLDLSRQAKDKDKRLQPSYQIQMLVGEAALI